MTPRLNLIPRYVNGSNDSLLVVERCPRSGHCGTVIFVPPFAEEMNRSRRMVTEQAVRLGARGFRTIVPDLSGTGDSFGHLEEASLDTWRQDLTAVYEDCAAGDNLPLVVIGIRLGALLAASWIVEQEVPVGGLLLWAPTRNGSAFMNQFLRLRLLSTMIAGSREREKISDLVDQLDRGQSIEVAGYMISPQLHRSIVSADLSGFLQDIRNPVCWIEVASRPDAPPPRPAVMTVEALQNDGRRDVQLQTVVGAKFWTSTETTVAPAVMDVSEDFIMACESSR